MTTEEENPPCLVQFHLCKLCDLEEVIVPREISVFLSMRAGQQYADLKECLKLVCNDGNAPCYVLGWTQCGS